MINLKFQFNGITFQENFAVVDSFHKKLILGIPFIRKFHAHLDFGNKTFYGAAQFDEIPLMDIEEFLVEARKGQVGMLFLNAEEDEDTGGIGDNKKDIMSLVKGTKKSYFVELIGNYQDIFESELDQKPPLRGSWDPKLRWYPILVLQLQNNTHCRCQNKNNCITK